MPNLQIYVPTKAYMKKLKEDAKAAGFDSVSSYLRAAEEFYRKNGGKKG